MKHCTTCQHLFSDALQVCPTDNAPLRVARELEPGMVIRGKYIVLEWIGAGGMAAVYRTRHRLLNEMRAVKVVSIKFAHDEDFLKRFRHEAAIARRLRHENAVWVEDLDELEDGRPLIAMEFLQGNDLRKLIKDHGPLSVERSLSLGAQVGSALSTAHKLGIIHRDIKPDNIFITRDAAGKELAKVLDFGIAKAKEGVWLDGYTPTQTGVLIGTPEYMSPEQAEGQLGDKLDGRSDIYSLGIVLYEMLTGQLPFRSDTPLGMCMHHLQTIPRPPHELRPDLRIPENVSTILMTALEKRRERRFQSAKEMVTALRNPAGWKKPVVNGGGALAPTKISSSITGKRSAGELTGALSHPAAATAPQETTAKIPLQAKSLPGGAQKEVPHPAAQSAPEVDRGRRFRILIVAVAVSVCVVAGYLLINIVQRRSATLHAHDSLLREEILERFRSSPALQGRGKAIAVAVSSDTVTLSGSVPFPEDKDKAGNEARSLPGISNVINDIVVVALPSAVAQPTPVTKAATDSVVQVPAKNSTSRRSGSVTATHSQNVRKANELVGLGKAAVDDGKYPEALNDLRQAMQLDPQNSGAREAWKRALDAQRAEQEVLGKKQQ